MAEVRFKDLVADDLFNFCAVLEAIGTEQIIGAFDPEEIRVMQNNRDTDVKSIGAVIAMKTSGILVKNFPKARKEIFGFFAGCMEWDNGKPVTAEELAQFKLGAFLHTIREFFKKDDLVDFFAELAGLLGMEDSGSKNSATGDTETPTDILPGASAGDS